MRVVQQGWECLAAREGGTVTALTTAEDASGTTVLFAATAVGIRRSADAGLTWTAQDVGGGAPFVTALAPSSNFAQDNTLFIGTADGCYRSEDGGQHWTLTLTGGRIFTLAVTPNDEGEYGTVFAGSELDGILTTDDGGKSWGGANAGLLDLTVLAIAFSPNFAKDGTGFAATAAGLYRTRNGGKSWRAIELPIEDPAVQCIAISPDFKTDRTVYAGTEANGLFRSGDAGNTWDEIPALNERSIASVAFAPDGSLIAAATDAGIAISRDGGESWELAGQELGFALSLAFVGDTLVAGLVRHGAARSTDGGKTWTAANNGLNAIPTLALVLSPAFEQDNTLFAAGLDDGVSVSRDGGTTWAVASNGLPDTTVYGIVPSTTYASDHTLYAATAAGIFRSTDAAASWQAVGGEGLPGPAGAIDLAPAVGKTPAQLLAVTLDGHLFISADGGDHWQAGGSFEGGTVVTLSVSPGYAKDLTIFVGTREDLRDGTNTHLLVLWRSNDGGRTWHRWLEERGRSALPLAVPAGYLGDGALFVGLDGRVAKPIRNTWRRGGGERRPLWAYTDLLDSEQRYVAITSLAVSPHYRNDSIVLAATSGGIYLSRDGGRHFAPWSGGMGTTPVVAVTATTKHAGGQSVYALGLGGTIWRRELGE